MLQLLYELELVIEELRKTQEAQSVCLPQSELKKQWMWLYNDVCISCVLARM